MTVVPFPLCRHARVTWVCDPRHHGTVTATPGTTAAVVSACRLLNCAG